MKYVCDVCGWIYDEEETGVKWEDLPEDFECPPVRGREGPVLSRGIR